MSINSSLVKLADKIDASNKSGIQPDYKNPNNSIEKSIERIADNYESGSGGSGGGLAINITGEFPDFTFDKTAGEIMNAFSSGASCVTVINDSPNIQIYALMLAAYDGESYEFKDMFISNFPGEAAWVATSAEDYPILQLEK